MESWKVNLREPRGTDFLTGYIDMAVNTTIEGATDFLQKSVKAARLLSSVVKACTKSVYVSLPILEMTGDEAKQKLQCLTAREIEILRLVDKKYPSRVIGERLGISERSVETHRTSACKNFRPTSTQEILEIFELARRN